VDLPTAEFTRSEDPLVRAYMEAFSGLPEAELPQSGLKNQA
jgi:hypothetical protein